MQLDEKNTFRSTNDLNDNQLKHHKNLSSNETNNQLVQSGLNMKQFTYLSPNNNNYSFAFTKETITQSSLFSSLKDKHKLIIASIIHEDTGAESSDLNQTLDSVIKGIEALSSFKITSSSILFIAFIQCIHKQDHYNHFFNQNKSLFTTNANTNDSSIGPPNSTHASFMVYNNRILTGLNVLILYKPKPKPTEIELLHCLYNDILPQLRSKNSTIHLVQIANGIILSPSSLNEMITSADAQSPLIVPCIETIPIGLFAQIEHYSNYQYNIFNINYYLMNRCLPVNHLLYLIRINDILYEDLITYFNTKINLDADIHNHDYLFSLYFTERNYSITYAKNTICSIKRNQITFDQMMAYHTDKMSGTFSSILNLFTFWVKGKMNNVSIINKLSLTLLLFGMFFDFCFPSMMSIIIYSIFNEAFQLADPRAAVFLTGLYLLFIMLTISFSIIAKRNEEKVTKIFFAFYIIFTVYYLLVVCCSVPAIHFINSNPSMDIYQFDIAAFCSIIVINVIVGFIPLLINYKSFFKNIVFALEYIGLGAPGFTSVFLIHSIVNASDMVGVSMSDRSKSIGGGKDNEVLNYHKAVVIGVYSGINALFICLLFFLTNRTMRANGVLSLGIIYTIYNCFKVVFVILGMFLDSRNRKGNSNKVQIKKEVKGQNEEIAMNNEKPLSNQSKHKDVFNAQDIDNDPIKVIEERDSICVDNSLNKNERRSESNEEKDNGNDRKDKNKWYDGANEDEIKEKSIELNIVNEANEGNSKLSERRDDNADNDNEEKELESLDKKIKTNGNEKEREKEPNENIKCTNKYNTEEGEEEKDIEEHQKKNEDKENDSDDNDVNNKEEKEDAVNQGINESKP